MSGRRRHIPRRTIRHGERPLAGTPPFLMRGRSIEGLSREAQKRVAVGLNLGPALGFLAVFFFIPLAIVVLYSFGVWAAPGETAVLGFEYYVELWTNAVYSRVILRSLAYAFIATVASLLIGYPVAYFIALRAGRYRNILILAILVPFWVSFVIRTYAMRQVFAEGGPIYPLLVALGLVQAGEPFLQTDAAVILGLVYNYVPFMILPLYANMVGFDVSLLEASQSLGAGRLRTLIFVTLPLTLGGIVAGSLLVFIPSTGELLVPEFLGGPDQTMNGQLLYTLIFQIKDWNVGSALAILLVAITLVLVFVYFRLLGRKQPVGFL